LQWISDHLTALVAAAAVISSLANRRRLKALHVDLNSRLSLLLKLSGETARAEGVAEGRKLGVSETADRVAEKERVEDRAEKKIPPQPLP
jgi:hypothetical protein